MYLYYILVKINMQIHMGIWGVWITPHLYFYSLEKHVEIKMKSIFSIRVKVALENSVIRIIKIWVWG